jgi:acyl-CoA thioester hydrolase
VIVSAHAHTDPNADTPPSLPSARSDAIDAALRPLAFAIAVRVYYEDTDAGGIVYYANWLRFFERARTDWLRALGAAHTRLAEEEGLAFVVREIAVDYRRPARLDDLLRIELRVLEAKRASWTLWQCARRAGESGLLVSATVRIAAIRRDDGRPTGFPRWLHERLANTTPAATPPAGLPR